MEEKTYLNTHCYSENGYTFGNKNIEKNISKECQEELIAYAPENFKTDKYTQKYGKHTA